MNQCLTSRSSTFPARSCETSDQKKELSTNRYRLSESPLFYPLPFDISPTYPSSCRIICGAFASCPQVLRLKLFQDVTRFDNSFPIIFFKVGFELTLIL